MAPVTMPTYLSIAARSMNVILRFLISEPRRCPRQLDEFLIELHEQGAAVAEVRTQVQFKLAHPMPQMACAL